MECLFDALWCWTKCFCCNCPQCYVFYGMDIYQFYWYWYFSVNNFKLDLKAIYKHVLNLIHGNAKIRILHQKGATALRLKKDIRQNWKRWWIWKAEILTKVKQIFSRFQRRINVARYVFPPFPILQQWVFIWGPSHITHTNSANLVQFSALIIIW